MLLIRRCWGRGYDVFGKGDGDVKADGEKGRVGNVGAKRSAVRELTCSHVSHTPLFPWFSLKSLVAELAAC